MSARYHVYKKAFELSHGYRARLALESASAATLPSRHNVGVGTYYKFEVYNTLNKRLDEP